MDFKKLLMIIVIFTYNTQASYIKLEPKGVEYCANVYNALGTIVARGCMAGSGTILEKAGECVGKIHFKIGDQYLATHYPNDPVARAAFRSGYICDRPYGSGCGDWLIRVEQPGKAVWCDTDGTHCTESVCRPVPSGFENIRPNTVTVVINHAAENEAVDYCITMLNILGTTIDKKCTTPGAPVGTSITLEKNLECVETLWFQVGQHHLDKYYSGESKKEERKALERGFISHRPYGYGCAGVGLNGSWYVKVNGYKDVEWCEADGTKCTPSYCVEASPTGGWQHTFLNTTPYPVSIVLWERSCRNDLIILAPFEEKTIGISGCWAASYYLFNKPIREDLLKIDSDAALKNARPLAIIPGPDKAGDYFIFVTYKPGMPKTPENITLCWY